MISESCDSAEFVRAAVPNLDVRGVPTVTDSCCLRTPAR